MKRGFSTAKIILFILLILVLGGGVFALYGLTLVPWYLPLIFAVAAGGITAVVIRNRADGRPSGLACAGWAAGAGILAAFMFLGINFLFADEASTHVEKATVAEVYTKKHNRTRRGARGRMIPTGETYNTYHVAIRFSDGREKSRQVTAGEYIRIKKGDPYEVKLQKGLLGFPVIKF